MSHEQLGAHGEPVESLLRAAYEHTKNRELHEAGSKLEQALAVDFDNSEVVTALKYVNFWKDRDASSRETSDPFERGEYLLGQWRLFDAFVRRIGEVSERFLYAIRQYAFGEALEEFERSDGDAGGNDPEILLRMGRCYKGTGEYDRALDVLSRAARAQSDDPHLLAELADSYALVNEIGRAKAFFREAFFLGPQKIDIGTLESDMIGRLITKLRELGYESPELEEWLPVYGVLYGVFSVKRELRSIEYGKLKQSIYALEREYHDKPDPDGVVCARLLNRYFWLIDHYTNTQEDQSKIDEVLLKIRSTSEKIYSHYVS